jgi:hypothetical protein
MAVTERSESVFRLRMIDSEFRKRDRARDGRGASCEDVGAFGAVIERQSRKSQQRDPSTSR